LAAKGLDARLMDLKLEQKLQQQQQHVPHYTKEQYQQLEQVRKELTQLESEYQEANEMELPEQAILEQVEGKKKELAELTKRFDQEAAAAAADKEKEFSSAPSQDAKPSLQPRQGGHSSKAAAAPHDATTGDRPRFERPSQRRQRLDEQQQQQQPAASSAAPRQQQHQQQHGARKDDSTNSPEAYSSFSTHQRRRRPDAV
jgi:hypothetical protein